MNIVKIKERYFKVYKMLNSQLYKEGQIVRILCSKQIILDTPVARRIARKECKFGVKRVGFYTMASPQR